MNWTPELRDFIQEHMNDDTAELLLAARKYLGIDVPFAVEQIEARRRLKGKLPEWYGNADLIMGGRVPAEQCSSEQTARYKRSIIEGQSLCDMTGGMGVDFWYMSEGMERAIYTERSEWLCEVAKHNFQMLQTLPSQQTLPSPSLQGGGSISANRGGNGETDEQGNHSLPAGRVRGVSAVGGVSAVIHCVDFLASSALHYTTKFPDEMDVLVSAGGVKHYLYEPDVTLMKAQAFGSLCHRFNVRQLEIGTHLMTSDEFIPDFPGRIFEVEEKIPFSSKVLKGLKKAISQANMATRNFVLTADEVSKKTGIKAGGEVYLIGAKVKDVGEMLF